MNRDGIIGATIGSRSRRTTANLVPHHAPEALSGGCRRGHPTLSVGTWWPHLDVDTGAKWLDLMAASVSQDLILSSDKDDVRSSPLGCSRASFLSSAKGIVRTILQGMCVDDNVTTCIEVYGYAGLLSHHGETQMPYERASGERPSSWWRGQGRKPAGTKEAPASGGHHHPRRRE